MQCRITKSKRERILEISGVHRNSPGGCKSVKPFGSEKREAGI